MIINIRKSNKSDLELIGKIAIQAFRPNFETYKKVMGTTMFKVYYPSWKEKKIREIAYLYSSRSCKLYVATINDKVVGFASYVTSKKSPHIAEISTNAVHPRYQRKGIGGSLYKYILNELKLNGVKYINVTTTTDGGSESARATYEKVGFKKSIQKITYYMDL